MHYLCELPCNADRPAEAVAADEKSFHCPAPKMTKGKNIKVTQDAFPCDHMTVDCILL